MRRTLLAFALLPEPLLADDIISIVPGNDQIQIQALRQIKKLDDANAFAYFMDAAPGNPRRIVQILFKAKIEQGGLDLNRLQCLDGSGTPVNLTATENLIAGVKACGIAPLANGKTRNLKIELPGVMFEEATRPVDLSTIASYRAVSSFSPKAVPGDREIFIGLEESLKQQLLADLQSH